MKPGRISISSLRSALAFGLVLWCAGAGCLAHGMAMAGASGPGSKSAKQDPKQSKMSMSGHSCCKARHRALQAGTVAPESTLTLPEESSDDALSCCPLTSGSFVSTSWGQTNDNNNGEFVAAAANEQGFAELAQTERAIPTRLSNHERTYLTCCVFLI